MPTNSNPLKICIATSDIVGPIRNGGIGTWYHACACAMAAAGHHVTVLFILGNHCENHSTEHWIRYYASRGVEFVPLPPMLHYVREPFVWTKMSYDVYLWLRDRCFDIIHFHEWRGHGFYSALAKRQGLAFQNTVLVVGTHSPLLWHKFGMAEYVTEVEELQTDHLERSSVALADVVVSPSQYMIRWIVEHGWKLPSRIDYIQYIQSHYLPLEQLQAAPPRVINQLVFFGRLETRKGLALFCDAIDRLVAEKAISSNVSLAFLGKRVWMNGADSYSYIQNRSKHWNLSWSVIDDKDHAGAIAYLKEPGRLAVICSLLENSPNTVLECLANAIPCLSTDVGGNPELVAEADRARTLFAPRAAELARKLAETLSQAPRPALPAVHPDVTKAQWLAWHQKYAAMKAELAPSPAGPANPLVSVVLVTRNRHHLLAQAIESIRKQTYANLELVLVDDGSTELAALAYLDQLSTEFAQRNWQIVRQANKYLGAARNNGARHARGDWLLFMDDDNLAKPKEVETFVHAAQHSNADILTCVVDMFNGELPPEEPVKTRNRWLPLGNALGAGAFVNMFGDANGLFRKSAFVELNGFSEEYGIGHEDYELYARAALRGYRLMVVPEALLWYRIGDASMLRTTSHFANNMRSLGPYLEHVGPDLAGVFEFAQGMFFCGRAGWNIPSTSAASSPAPTMAETNNDPAAYQRVVDEYWNSLSWRLSAPVRNALMRSKGLPPQTKPIVHTRPDAARVVEEIRTSVAWEATGVLRAMGRVVQMIRTKM
jgi:O-antigen biosynthesis protein